MNMKIKTKVDIFPRIDWAKFMDKLVGFDEWCAKWKKYHNEKQEDSDEQFSNESPVSGFPE